MFGSLFFLPSYSMQCLLQQGTDSFISLLLFLVQLDKKIGRSLQRLVDSAGVLAVQCKFLQPLYKTMEQCKGFVVYIIDSHTAFTPFNHKIIFIRENSLQML